MHTYTYIDIHIQSYYTYTPLLIMQDQLDNDLNNILQRLNIIMKSVGGNTRHTSIISDPFLDLRHKMSKKLKEAYEILDEIQSYSRSTKHMTISMTKKSELRELISELTVDLEKLQAWLRTEQSKRKSKFSDDELTGRALDITNMEHDIQAIRDRQKIGYIRMHAGSGHGAIEMSTSRDLAMRIQRPSTAASNTSISCGGALNTTPLTDEQKSQLKSIRQRDEDMGVLMDGIEEGAMNLRYVAIAQNEEVKLHSIMLDEVGVNMDSAQDKVTNVNRRLQVTLKKFRTADRLCIDIVCFLITVGLLMVLYQITND
mmetsp:Transcript_11284/g.17168  ORF Transcript_11284/g.17168 Transcript_11284/m.17168 type:complete len:314 (+) Transcript_11284:86-1027(+)